MDHLDESTIALFLERRLPDDQVRGLQHHIDDCDECREILAGLAKLSALRLAEGSDEPSLPPLRPQVVLERGDRIGRYVVLDLVGAGAMGAVYAAFDPELDRKVAVKLLHGTFPDGNTRLQREAQALARVSHPGVVAVHDVGTHGDRVFIAMEYVAGGTFRSWLRERPRTWRDILARGIEAARGLAAAHATGLVHRDVKPDNILVDVHGHARIGDFGLAAAATESLRRQSDPLLESQSKFGVELTASNAILGTPAYMAPEQLAGEPANARSDQFGFCASLYEALYGVRPYPGTSIEEIVAAMKAGKVAPPVSDSGVPKRVRVAIERGLAIEPAARFPAMDELVARLAHEPWSRRRIGVIALGAAAIGGLAFGISAMTGVRDSVAPCTSAASELARVWNPARRAQIEQRIAATGVPFANDTWTRVARSLDAYGNAWVTQHTQACEATAVHRTQSAALLDRRMSCLGRKLIDLDAVVETLGQIDRDRVRHAVDAARNLPAQAICADPDALANAPDPAIAADVARVSHDIARSFALLHVGVPDKAAALAKTAVDDAEKLAYPPLVAEAHDLRGQASVDVGDMALARESFERAVLAATHARDEEREGRSLANLALVLRDISPDGKIAIEHARHALAIAERGGRAPLFEAQIRYANIRVLAGIDHSAVVEHYKRGRAILDGATDAGALLLEYETIDAKLSINPFEALDKYQVALATAERTYGPNHPQVAAVLVEMASSAIVADLQKDARAYAERAAAILAPYPGDRVELRRIDARFENDLAKRRVILEEVVRASEAASPKSAQLAFDREALAETLLELGAHREGIVQVDGAIAIWEQLYGGHFEGMITSLVTKAELHAGLEDWDATAAAAERAVALSSKGGMRDLVKSMARLILMDSYFRQKRWAQALTLIEQAAPTVRLALLGDPSTKVLDFYEAACRWELGQDRPAQLKKARAAFALLKTATTSTPDSLAPLAAWLAGKR